MVAIALAAARLRRLSEELSEHGLVLDDRPEHQLVLAEIDAALRPNVHERRVASIGTVVQPTTASSTWEAGTDLRIIRRPIGTTPLKGARLFTDGLSCWLVRSATGDLVVNEWMVFDRPTGSERDLVVLAEVLGATVVQRHPSGSVRIAGADGVWRWEGVRWHHEPPIASWVDAVAACAVHGDREVLETLLEFAVHDLGSRGIGAILIYRPDGEADATHADAALQARLPLPPPLTVRRPTDLAPLSHALAQLDGATVFDDAGTLRQIGVRLVPSADAESSVEGYRGMRHTSARRYSADDPTATVIIVSEDGPVTVLRNGEFIGSSAATS